MDENHIPIKSKSQNVKAISNQSNLHNIECGRNTTEKRKWQTRCEKRKQNLNLSDLVVQKRYVEVLVRKVNCG